MAPAALTTDTHTRSEGEMKKATAGVMLDHAIGDVHTSGYALSLFIDTE